MLYHVSFNHKEEYQILKPYIPKSPLKTENQEIKRICVAETLAGCLKGASKGFFEFEWIKEDPYYFYEHGDLDMGTEKWGVAMRVYELDTESDVKPQELVERYGVSDANKTNEHWLLEETKPTRSYLLFLTELTQWMGGVSYKAYYLPSATQIVTPQDYAFFLEACEHKPTTLKEKIAQYQAWHEAMMIKYSMDTTEKVI